jgi:hypothetical protein
MSSATFAEKLDSTRQVDNPKSLYGAVPAKIRAELNPDTDHDSLVRMEHLARRKRMLRPNVTDEELADYLALAANCDNFDQWLKLRRGVAVSGLSRGTIAWVLGTLAIVALLATGLIAAIAVSVSSL